MKVVKRDGSLEAVSYDKVTQRIARLCVDLPTIDPAKVAQLVIPGIFDGVHTEALDTLAGETAIALSTSDPAYGKLAARIYVSNLHKTTPATTAEVVARLGSVLSESMRALLLRHAAAIDAAVDFERDYAFDYFGMKTLRHGYLLATPEGQTVERPQHMFMRVALTIHGDDLVRAFETYDLMSRKCFTHATPTMFNAGTRMQQMASCFLLCMTDDSIDGIYETLGRCAKLSKGSGGIGVNASNIRALGSYIAGTNGRSNGLVPMLRVYDATARYVDQGGGKRKGSIAIYLEPWHADVLSFLELRKIGGKEEMRTRDLFTALWVPDLFMQRVENDGEWSLMCPNECPGLVETWGDAFVELYERYEREGRQRRTMKARELFFAIIEAQMEGGTPFMLFKDACNAKSNHQHLGTIRGSNLCTEIIEFTAPDEVAVCNLASLSLPAFVVNESTYDYDALYRVAYVAATNLNRVIDANHYPLEEARRSNLRHRPIGIGVQGLQNVFFKMRCAFDSEKAAELNRAIFETIYYAALHASCDAAQRDGPYQTYAGSPMSRGLLQFDMWGVKPPADSRWDWAGLRAKIALYGVRNSLLISPMPTASTAQILGNVECFEPMASNMYTRSTLAGTFPLVNEFLVEDLRKLGLWNDALKNEIVKHGGSIQKIDRIPADLRTLYKTVWEISQRTIANMAAARGPYIDQSQSLNIHIASPTFEVMSTLHTHTWKLGLKTGMYYLRTKAAASADKVTVAVEGPACSRDNPDCLSCGS